MPAKRSERPDVELAVRLGWKPDGTTGSGHLRFRHPAGAVCFLPSSPGGGRRSRQNNVAVIRRLTAQLKARPGLDSTT